MSLYILVQNEHIDWSSTKILGVYTHPEKIIESVLSNYDQKMKEVIIAYCMGFFDNEESNKENYYDYSILGDGDAYNDVGPFVDSGDYYTFTLLKCDLNESINTTVCTVSGHRIDTESEDKNIVFNGSFQKLFKYMLKNNISQHKPYGQTQEGFLALMKKEKEELLKKEESD